MSSQHETDLDNPKDILRHVLKTLLDKCFEEAGNDCPSVPLSNILERVKHYTGLSNSVVENLLSDITERSQLNLSSRILVLSAVKNLCIKRGVPTFNSIFQETHTKLQNRSDEPITDISEFMKEMKILGYILKETIHNSMIVMENPEVRFERFMYLEKIARFRKHNAQWPQIVYVDERLINLTKKFAKPTWSDSMQHLSLDMDESVFYHAVSNSGLIAGLFSNQNDFNKWVTDVLILQLRSPTVVIMDTLHGPPENVSSITRYHSKAAMLRWLANNNVPCTSNMSKPALYDLIDKCNEHEKVHHVDRILRSQGHEVLRLPRHFSDLSITTQLWNVLEKNESVVEACTLMELQSVLLKQINAIIPVTWAGYEQEVIKMEEQIFSIDTALENVCDLYEIKM